MNLCSNVASVLAGCLRLGWVLKNYQVGPRRFHHLCTVPCSVTGHQRHVRQLRVLRTSNPRTTSSIMGTSRNRNGDYILNRMAIAKATSSSCGRHTTRVQQLGSVGHVRGGLCGVNIRVIRSYSSPRLQTVLSTVYMRNGGPRSITIRLARQNFSISARSVHQEICQ